MLVDFFNHSVFVFDQLNQLNIHSILLTNDGKNM